MENCRVKEVPLKLYTHLHENTDNLKNTQPPVATVTWENSYLLNLLLLAIFSTPEQTKWKSSSCSLLEFYPMSLKQDLESPKPAHASFHNAGKSQLLLPGFLLSFSYKNWTMDTYIAVISQGFRAKNKNHTKFTHYSAALSLSLALFLITDCWPL